MISEGVPVIGGFGVDNAHNVPMTPWARLGCEGAYFKFFGSDGVTGMYVGKIAKASRSFSNAIACRRVYSGNRAVSYPRR
jgi:hypothetical protein